MRFLSMFLLLGACGSLSLPTIVQLSRLNPLTSDPSGFVAAVVLPNTLDVPENGATLGFTWVSGSETIGGAFALQRHGAFDGVEIETGPGQQVMFFDLAAEDAAAIRQAQATIIERKDMGVEGDGAFSVFVAPCARGEVAVPLISTYLRIEVGGPFLPLLQDFDMRQEISEGQLFEMPDCGA